MFPTGPFPTGPFAGGAFPPSGEYVPVYITPPRGGMAFLPDFRKIRREEIKRQLALLELSYGRDSIFISRAGLPDDEEALVALLAAYKLLH